MKAAIMKAEILPLGSKYYGTIVEITDPSFRTSTIDIWVMGNGNPSRRELDGYVKKSDGKWYIFERELDEWFEYEITDSHYETETSLEIAEKLVEAINK